MPISKLLKRARYFTVSSLYRNARLNWRYNRGFGPRRILLVSPSVDLNLARSARICLADDARFNFGFVPHCFAPALPAKLCMQEKSCLTVKGNCTMTTGTVVFVAKQAALTVGRNVHVISDTRILAYADIEIGDDCIIGWESQIMSGDGHAVYRGGEWVNQPEPVKIGDQVWIGSRATILKGVTIGAGSVIGANAVVTGDVPEHCVVAGNPARVVAKDVTWRL